MDTRNESQLGLTPAARVDTKMPVDIEPGWSSVQGAMAIDTEATDTMDMAIWRRLDKIADVVFVEMLDRLSTVTYDADPAVQAFLSNLSPSRVIFTIREAIGALFEKWIAENPILEDREVLNGFESTMRGALAAGALDAFILEIQSRAKTMNGSANAWLFPQDMITRAELVDVMFDFFKKKSRWSPRSYDNLSCPRCSRNISYASKAKACRVK
ncbi:MAG: hypothetical protein QNJ97_11360 [Myxococcota bacterium]|nr:hypothetical protein [Myxococcota bacterium]